MGDKTTNELPPARITSSRKSQNSSERQQPTFLKTPSIRSNAFSERFAESEQLGKSSTLSRTLGEKVSINIVFHFFPLSLSLVFPSMKLSINRQFTRSMNRQIRSSLPNIGHHLRRFVKLKGQREIKNEGSTPDVSVAMSSFSTNGLTEIRHSDRGSNSIFISIVPPIRSAILKFNVQEI